MHIIHDTVLKNTYKSYSYKVSLKKETRRKSSGKYKYKMLQKDIGPNR